MRLEFVDGVSRFVESFFYERYFTRSDIVLVGKRVATLPFRKIPRFPVLLSSGRTLILTPIQVKAIGGVAEKMEQTFARIARHYGVILHESDVTLSVLHHVPEEERPVVERSFFDLPFVSCVDLDLPHIPKNGFGWLGDENREVLRQIIPGKKVIVELGTWFGKSAWYIKRWADPSTVLLCVDWFRSPFVSSYRSSSPHPLDRFYHQVLRFETFHRNMQRFKGTVYSVRYDCQTIVDLLHFYGVSVDMFYIDFQKKTEPLIHLLRRIHTLFPASVIIGDDAIYPSVRRAISKADIPGATLLETCYILNYTGSVTTPKTDRKKAALRECLSNRCSRYKYEAAVEILNKGDPKQFVRFVKKYKLDMNKPRKELHMRNTLYHVYYMLLPERPYEAILHAYQPVDSTVLNLCLLTPFDYRNHTIDFR